MDIKQFINDEMTRRDLSIRQFADIVGVEHTTISRLLSSKRPKPTLTLLVKLADATNVSLETLTALAYPQLASKYRPSPTSLILAERFDSLPENIRNAIELIMRSNIAD